MRKLFKNRSYSSFWPPHSLGRDFIFWRLIWSGREEKSNLGRLSWWTPYSKLVGTVPSLSPTRLVEFKQTVKIYTYRLVWLQWPRVRIKKFWHTYKKKVPPQTWKIAISHSYWIYKPIWYIKKKFEKISHFVFFTVTLWKCVSILACTAISIGSHLSFKLY